MAWLFNKTQEKPAAAAKSPAGKKPGLLASLLKGKPSPSPQNSQPAKPNSPANGLHISDEAFSELDQLMAETHNLQTDPSQEPIYALEPSSATDETPTQPTGNPYRTSLSLEDMPDYQPHEADASILQAAQQTVSAPSAISALEPALPEISEPAAEAPRLAPEESAPPPITATATTTPSTSAWSYEESELQLAPPPLEPELTNEPAAEVDNFGLTDDIPQDFSSPDLPTALQESGQDLQGLINDNVIAFISQPKTETLPEGTPAFQIDPSATDNPTSAILDDLYPNSDHPNYNGPTGFNYPSPPVVTTNSDPDPMYDPPLPEAPSKPVGEASFVYAAAPLSYEATYDSSMEGHQEEGMGYFLGDAPPATLETPALFTPPEEINEALPELSTPDDPGFILPELAFEAPDSFDIPNLINADLSAPEMPLGFDASFDLPNTGFEIGFDVPETSFEAPGFAETLTPEALASGVESEWETPEACIDDPIASSFVITYDDSESDTEVEVEADTDFETDFSDESDDLDDDTELATDTDEEGSFADVVTYRLDDETLTLEEIPPSFEIFSPHQEASDGPDDFESEFGYEATETYSYHEEPTLIPDSQASEYDYAAERPEAVQEIVAQEITATEPQTMAAVAEQQTHHRPQASVLTSPSISTSIQNFESQILWQESRFVQRSINDLVSRYFEQNPPPPAE